jgi:hypothetical protein
MKLKRLQIGIDVALGHDGIVSENVLRPSSPQKEAPDDK